MTNPAIQKYLFGLYGYTVIQDVLTVELTERRRLLFAPTSARHSFERPTLFKPEHELGC